MSKSPFPPAPPNCEYFQKLSGYGLTFVWPNAGEPDASEGGFADLLMPLCKSNPRDKVIIASVARCAWADEAERLASEEMKANYIPGDYHSYTEAEIFEECCPKATEAKSHAAAWQEWGKGGDVVSVATCICGELWDMDFHETCPECDREFNEGFEEKPNALNEKDAEAIQLWDLADEQLGRLIWTFERMLQAIDDPKSNARAAAHEAKDCFAEFRSHFNRVRTATRPCPFATYPKPQPVAKED